MIRGRIPSAVGLVLVAAVTGAVVATAASLPITSGPLSTYSVSGSVPVSTCTLTANADTYVDEPSTSNFGGDTTLQISTGFFDNQHTFVKFDVASCSIPSNAEVRTSTLTVYMWAAPTSSYSAEVRRITGSWGELTADWFEYPSTAGSATSSFSTGTAVGSKSVSVLSDVEGFVAGTTTNYGWRVKPSSDGQGLAQFRSREHTTSSERPQLTITYYR